MRGPTGADGPLTRKFDMTEARLPIRIVALYRFTAFHHVAAIRAPLLETCLSHGVKGTLLLAPEGINGTLAGSDDGIGQLLAHIRALPGCTDLEVKESRAATMPFYRMKVRIKREIVSMGRSEIDPMGDVGHYVAPEDWNALIDDPETILIDTRNDYEVAIGTFRKAIDPRTSSFRDFPAWFEANRDRFEKDGDSPRIAMFCTGGIRCEKATAFLKSEGLDNVHHLRGGILSYLEKVAPEQSRWDGECFVFDERVSVGHGLVPGSHELCRACRRPVAPEQRGSEHFISGISCPACYSERSDEQRARYAERHRQSLLAGQRGVAHIGAAMERTDDG